MARKPGDMGMLGLTEGQKDFAEQHVGINKEEWDKEQPKSWGEKFSDGVKAAKDKIKNFNKLELTTIDFGRHDKEEAKEEQVVESEEVAEEINFKEDGTVIEGEETTETEEKQVEETSAEVQEQTEELEDQTSEETLEDEEDLEALNAQAQELKAQVDARLEDPNNKLEEMQGAYEKLQELKALVEEQMQKIDELLSKRENPDNVVDMQKWKEENGRAEKSSESKVEKGELYGDAAVVESLNRYGGEYIKNEDGLGYLEGKFEDNQSNGADAMVALSTLTRYKQDREDGKFGDRITEIPDNHPLNQAIEHLQNKVDEDKGWKQTEGQISDWVEMQAHFPDANGEVDTKLLTTVENLRKVSSSTDVQELSNAQHALEGLQQDKNFIQQLNLDDEGQEKMNAKLEEFQQELKQKRLNTRNNNVIQGNFGQQEQRAA